MLDKRIFSAAAVVAISMIAVGAHAQSMEKTRYIGVGLAQQSIDGSGWEDSSALLVRGGMPLKSVHENLSLEAEVTQSSPTYEYTDSVGTTYSFDGTLTTYAVYGKYEHPLTKKIGIYGRAGYLYESFSWDGSYESSTDSGLSYGVGGTFKLNDSFKLFADYTVIEKDVTNMGIGATYSY